MLKIKLAIKQDKVTSQLTFRNRPAADEGVSSAQRMDDAGK